MFELPVSVWKRLCGKGFTISTVTASLLMWALWFHGYGMQCTRNFPGVIYACAWEYRLDKLKCDLIVWYSMVTKSLRSVYPLTCVANDFYIETVSRCMRRRNLDSEAWRCRASDNADSSKHSKPTGLLLLVHTPHLTHHTSTHTCH